jgi:hypothetical protein
MKAGMRVEILGMVLLTVTACGGHAGGPRADGGTSSHDAGATTLDADTSSSTDASSAVTDGGDLLPADAAAVDASLPDASPPDAGAPDAGATVTCTTVGWSARRVANEGSITPTSATLDASGRPHVAFFAWYNRDLGHAYQQPDLSYTDSIVYYGGAIDVGQSPSAAIDDDQRLHVAFQDTQGAGYGTRQLGSGGWTWEHIEAGWVGTTTLALAPDGSVHAAYYFGSGDADLHHATRAPSGGWTVETVDEEGATGLYPAMAFAADGTLAMTYWDASLNVVRHARKPPGGSWTRETLPVAGKHTSLRIDADGVEHLAVHDPATRDVVYGRRAPGGSFVFTPVADTGGVPSLALDRFGHVFIGFYDSYYFDLTLAHLAPGATSFTLTDLPYEFGNRADTVSLAIDDDGRVHFIYYLVSWDDDPSIWDALLDRTCD